MSTNKRNEAWVSSLQSRARSKFASKRVLDMGCTYGGLSIALAKSGVAVTGIDTSPKLIAYAEANAYNDSDISFQVLDISDVSIRRHFSHGSFELIF